MCLLLLTGFEPRSFGSPSATLSQLSHPVTPPEFRGCSCGLSGAKQILDVLRRLMELCQELVIFKRMQSLQVTSGYVIRIYTYCVVLICLSVRTLLC